jgi:hypothetical protein
MKRKIPIESEAFMGVLTLLVVTLAVFGLLGLIQKFFEAL